MDFGVVYTQEQERFRTEVRGWLEENVPEEMKVPYDEKNYTPEMHEFWKEKQNELGKKGWLFSTYKKEDGGGGLSPDHRSVIEEEFRELKEALNTKNNEVHEAADLLYHLLVALEAADIKFGDVLKELEKRKKQSGLEEKNNRS